MAEQFTVHAFGVKLSDGTQALEDVLKLIQAETIEQRNREIKGATIRIEDIKKKNGMWYMDFIKIRDTHGPGKGSKTKAVKGFTFTGDETFCEETAILFIPATHHLLVQYNHYGVKYSAIEDYFSQYNDAVNNVYELTTKYDADVERQFESRKLIRKLELAIDPRHLTKEDKKKGTAVYDAIDVGDKSDAAQVEISVSAGLGKKSQLNSYIEKTVEHLRRLHIIRPNGVSKINATVVGVDEKVAVLDLIAQRLKRTFKDIPVGPDKRWPVGDRYHGLDKARLGWKNILK
jgi:hypothetical protein